MREDVLWLKLSASINYFLRYNYDRYRTNEKIKLFFMRECTRSEKKISKGIQNLIRKRVV